MHDVIVEKLLGLIEGDELRKGHPNAISEEDTEESPTKSGRNLVTDRLRILEVGHRVVFWFANKMADALVGEKVESFKADATVVGANDWVEATARNVVIRGAGI